MRVKRVFSGIQPTGIPHLGNYLGMMRPCIRLQEEMDCFYCIVNLHAITIPQSPDQLRDHTLDMAAMFVAMGLDPAKAVLFVQSHVRAHNEAGWMLQCVARMGELNRMIQFKEKGKGSDSAVTGLFTYPVLQAADILLYQVDFVPVGEDQRQHLELTRDLADRFNRDYGDTFTVPETMIGQVGARIMALDAPEKKMSKSAESAWSYIGILDDAKTIEKKIKRAVTDSENEVRMDLGNKPGVSNLLVIYSLLADTPVVELEKKYSGLSYGAFKKDLIEVTVEHLTPIATRFQEIRHSGELLDILHQGAARANEVADVTLAEMQRKMGLM